jgi:hypothetical protein
MRAIRTRTRGLTAVAPDRLVRRAAVVARRKFVGQGHYSAWRRGRCHGWRPDIAPET